jgi:dihydroorotase-like cyclic amidohydrolase
MRIDPCDQDAFAGYMTALRSLEEAFIMAGVPVSFHCLNSSAFGKTVVIKKGKAATHISLEGDSSAQDLKDVAKAIRL